MSFTIWFISLCLISLGIGALIEPWLEKSAFKLIFFPGVLLSGVWRLAGARLAGLPVKERRILTGTGRGVRVDISKAPWHRILILSVLSFGGPIATVLVANEIAGRPLRLYNYLPALTTDSRALVQIPYHMGLYLRQVWILLKTMAATDPILLLWAYLFVGVLLSNPPAKRESAPLCGAALLVGGLVWLGLTVKGGSDSHLAVGRVWAGLSLAFAFSLLTAVMAILLAAVHKARSGSDSEGR